jgi:hypothetical protein
LEVTRRDAAEMSRPRVTFSILHDDLYIQIEPWPPSAGPAKHHLSAIDDSTFPVERREGVKRLGPRDRKTARPSL